MKKIVYSIIFILSSIILTACLTGKIFSVYYTYGSGNNVYSKASEKIIVFNYGKNVKSIGYCFTVEDTREDYVKYDGDISKRLIMVSIDYPDSIEEERICFNIKTDEENIVNCDINKYIVDSKKPVIEPLYSELIFNGDEKDLNGLFEVKSETGIKSFSCNKKNDVVDCQAVGKNGLKSSYQQMFYVDRQNPLAGKSVLFVGDSITEAIDELDGYDGWAGRIGFSNQMNWKNVGVGGATISKVKKKKHIVEEIKENKDEKYDYVILQGGINDANHHVELGEINDSFDVDDFDNETFAGGLEELFYYTKKYYPDSKIGFIITYKTPNSDWGESVRNRDEQINLTKKICDKWDIPYLDLYDGMVYEDGKKFNYDEILKVDTGEMFYQESKKQVHLSRKGYDVVSKYIDIWMKTL